MARPVQVLKPGQAFAFQEEANEGKTRSIRKRPRGQGGYGGWIALGVAFLVLVIGAGAVALNWQRIQDRFAAARPEPEGVVKKKKSKEKGKVATADSFPRRALLISVHNYLYMNPINAVTATDGIGMAHLVSSLNRGLNISLSQITELSDAHPKNPRPTLKSVIEEAVGNFLATSRKQDRVIVVFAGHAIEVEGKAYLVPLEGEREQVGTLIPLSWMLDKLAKADCRQKVFILDGNRSNAAQGEERPTAGPMTEAFEKELASPPAGVQVWAACGKGQVSHEFESSSLGLFLDSFRLSLTNAEGRTALQGRIQKPEESIPVEVFHPFVNAKMADHPSKVKQVSVAFGKEPSTGADFDKDEPPAKKSALPDVKSTSQREVTELLAEISLPSMKNTAGSGADLSFSSLPPFPEEVMRKLGGGLPDDSPLKIAVQKGRAALWAISQATIPTELTEQVSKIRTKLKVDLGVLETKFTKPVGGEMAVNRFKAGFKARSMNIARVVALLENILDDLKEAAKERKVAPPRWQANYDYILARVQAQLAYLEEYNSLLGQMQKELPSAEAFHAGWRVSSKEKASDPAGKKYDRAARALYSRIVEANAKSPYEVIAKRDRITALGLEWVAYSD